MRFLLLSMLVLFGRSLHAKEPYHLYLEADFSHYVASSKSILSGLKIALEENNYRWKGHELVLKSLDHRGNTRRSQKNFKKINEDPRALAVFSGMHSPPLLAQRDWINEQDMTLLVPWAAAGPITRGKSSVNRIFRCSVDDAQVGGFMIKSLEVSGFKRPFLLLENTGWGKGNEKNMKAALKDSAVIEMAGLGWFEWNVSQTSLLLLLDSIEKSKADAIVFVGNMNEGVRVMKALLDHNIHLPIFSHWGITGGDFGGKMGEKALSSLDLNVIQTKFNRKHRDWKAMISERLARAAEAELGTCKTSILTAPTGFFHAHDLMKILFAALEKVDPELPKAELQQELRLALESVGEVEGLMKTYQKPFSSYEGGNEHEALGEEDLCFGRFLPSGEMKIE